MSELVRVRIGDAHKTVGKAFAEKHGLSPLKADATDKRGNALPTSRPKDEKSSGSDKPQGGPSASQK